MCYRLGIVHRVDCADVFKSELKGGLSGIESIVVDGEHLRFVFKDYAQVCFEGVLKGGVNLAIKKYKTAKVVNPFIKEFNQKCRTEVLSSVEKELSLYVSGDFRSLVVNSDNVQNVIFEDVGFMYQPNEANTIVKVERV